MAFPTKGYFFKKPIPIKIEPVLKETRIQTLEGEEKALPDTDTFIVTGVKGEQYFISGNKLRQGYDMVGDHLYTKKPIPVYAEVTDKIEEFKLSWGNIQSKPGYYIINNGDEKYPCDPAIFRETYAVFERTRKSGGGSKLLGTYLYSTSVRLKVAEFKSDVTSMMDIMRQGEERIASGHEVPTESWGVDNGDPAYKLYEFAKLKQGLLDGQGAQLRCLTTSSHESPSAEIRTQVLADADNLLIEMGIIGHCTMGGGTGLYGQRNWLLLHLDAPLSMNIANGPKQVEKDGGLLDDVRNTVKSGFDAIRSARKPDPGPILIGFNEALEYVRVNSGKACRIAGRQRDGKRFMTLFTLKQEYVKADKGSHKQSHYHLSAAYTDDQGQSLPLPLKEGNYGKHVYSLPKVQVLLRDFGIDTNIR